MANASNFTRGFTPASNPERGNNIMGNAFGVYLCYFAYRAAIVV